MNRNQNISASLVLLEYTYDFHGNMLSMPHLTSIGWDYKDQMVCATDGTVNSYYNYDASGMRSRKVVVKPGGIREERYYVGGYEVFKKYLNNALNLERKTINIHDVKLVQGNNDGNEENTGYSIDKNKRIAIVDLMTVDNGEIVSNPTPIIRYQYDNHLGSACLELDESANIITYEEYHPFGTTSYRSGSTEAEVSLKKYKYVGKERDEETGLYYYGARYFAAWLCRFVSVDPLQHEYPHYTPYQYAGNKPITYIDLDGLEEGSLSETWKEYRKKIELLRNPKTFIFDQNGQYTGKTVDSDKIQIGIQNSTTGKLDYFALNDPANDALDIVKGKINKVEIVTPSQIMVELKEAGVFNTDENPTIYIERESRPAGEKSVLSGKSSGKLDFAGGQLLAYKTSTLFLIKGTHNVAYNRLDFGNFLWGNAGAALKIGLLTLKSAAHANNAVNSKTDNPDLNYNIADSKEDQKAIENGYNYFINLMKQLNGK